MTHQPESAATGASTDPRQRGNRPTARKPGRTPLEIILAGREAAGCTTDPPASPVRQVAKADSDQADVLCFLISGATFGIDIMQIREIVKPRPVTEVPRAPSFVAGVISLRGVIIPVLDLHDRLGLERSAAGGSERLIVVKTGPQGDLTGLLVDRVLQVARLTGSSEPGPPFPATIDPDFVVGIGSSADQNIILLNPGRIADLQLIEGSRP